MKFLHFGDDESNNHPNPKLRNECVRDVCVPAENLGLDESFLML